MLFDHVLKTVQDNINVEVNVLNGVSMAIGEFAECFVPCQQALHRLSITARLFSILADFLPNHDFVHNQDLTC